MRREMGTAEITAQHAVELRYFLLDVIHAGMLSILLGAERSP